MRTVLLAWELGGGFGHTTALLHVARRLTASGFRCVAAVKNIVSAAALRSAGVEVLQAPAWPIFFERDQHKDAQSSVTLGDTLGDGGLADPVALRALVAAWRALIALIKP